LIYFVSIELVKKIYDDINLNYSTPSP